MSNLCAFLFWQPAWKDWWQSLKYTNTTGILVALIFQSFGGPEWGLFFAPALENLKELIMPALRFSRLKRLWRHSLIFTHLFIHSASHEWHKGRWHKILWGEKVFCTVYSAGMCKAKHTHKSLSNQAADGQRSEFKCKRAKSASHHTNLLITQTPIGMSGFHPLYHIELNNIALVSQTVKWLLSTWR